MSTYSPPRLRAPTACVACNKKKVRCIFDTDSRVCQHCRRHQWPCLQRERKRSKTQHRALAAPSTVGNDLGQAELQANELRLNQAASTPSNAPRATPVDVTPIRDPAARDGAPSSNPYMSKSSDGGFMERAHYFHDSRSSNSAQDRPYVGSLMDSPTEDDFQILQLQRAFDLPPRAIREGLVDTFMKRCAPWMPIVERSWLEDSEDGSPSALLLQSVFLAASRVTAAPGVATYASSREFYRRAKALFWSGWEKNPLTVIAAVCILHWYNPEGPERVSTNTSGFWRYVAVGLAHQIGLHKEPARTSDRRLRRRLWWSLFARDCLISAGQGRPLAVDLGECDIKAPCPDDFKDSTADADLFSAYVEICSILGQLTRHCRRNALNRDSRRSIYNSLYRWSRELTTGLRLFQSSSEIDGVPHPGPSLSRYNFEARQLHIPYFVCLIILCRPATQASTPSGATILASSYIAGVFEDFLARDEIRYLGSIFTFYLLAAGTGLLSSKRYPDIWEKARQDLQTIYISLEELAKRWPSATGALRALRSLDNTQNDAPPYEDHWNSSFSLIIAEEHRPLFVIFGSHLSWAWESFMATDKCPAGSNHDMSRPNATPCSQQYAGEVIQAENSNAALPSENGPPLTMVDGDPFHIQYEGIGDWLLEDYDWSGELSW
ncbi:fungal-specific transcription factor domain-containing protein [Aspergillus floccosus]